MSSVTDNSADSIVRRLRELADDSPDLLAVVRPYEALLPLLRDAELSAIPVPLTQEQAQIKLAAGVPLLSGINLELDLTAAANLLLRLARAMDVAGDGKDATWQTPAASPATAIRQALEEGRLKGEEILSDVVGGNRDAVREVAKRNDLDPDLFRTLAEQALKPALHAWCRHLVPLTGGISWDHGYCLVCGAAATLGELQGNGEELHLRCGQCGADWPFQRLRCARCGTDDHTMLRCVFPENARNRLRLELCDHCRGYLKVITAFSPTPPEMLPVADLATLYLDVIAQDQGYELAGAT